MTGAAPRPAGGGGRRQTHLVGVKTPRRLLPLPLPLALAAALAPGCRPRGPAPPDSGPPLVVTAVRRGIASHYAGTLAGRPTASGEPYDPAALTAAHRTLPLGTRVRVSREGAGAVIVRINDRGPYAEERLLDLSEAAARRLGMWGTIARVKVEVLRD